MLWLIKYFNVIAGSPARFLGRGADAVKHGFLLEQPAKFPGAHCRHAPCSEFRRRPFVLALLSAGRCFNHVIFMVPFSTEIQG